MALLIFVWRRAIRRFAPRHLDALAGRQGRADWSLTLRRGILQGFLGGSRPWIVLGGLAAVVRVTYKLGEGDGKVLATEVLRAGEGLLVTDTGVERRAAGSPDLPGRPFKPGERALLIDSRDRRYLLTLAVGAQFHSHHGFIAHDDVLGRGEGAVIRMQDGARYLCVRPTLADVVLKMPRGAQVIYPKDLGPILLLADIFPGARVLESGVGSGALSMTLLRAGADITGYELRQDFADKANENVSAFVGADVVAERYRVHVRDVYDGIDERDLDRIVLDLPEPWQVVAHAEHALAPGGILVSYLPSIVQVQHLRSALDRSGFGMAETQEVLVRTWKVEGSAVRPDHRMVAHTGFLTSARLLDPPGGGTEG